MALFLMLFSFSFALAENVSDNSSNENTPMLISAPVEAGDLNESEVENEAKGNLFWKQMDIWFTFNQEKKAEKELKLAEFQLVRARIAAKNNNTRAMEGALEAHRRLIEKVQERVSKIENGNASEKLIGLDRAIQVHQARIARFNAQLNNSNLSAEQIENLQEIIEKAQENTQHLREVANEKRLEVGNKLREKNFSDDSSNDENETGDNSEDLEDDSEDSSDDELLGSENGSRNGRN